MRINVERKHSFADLANGERVGLGAVEITTVPHLSILQKRFTAVANMDTEYKQDMSRLLSEVFQNYKNASIDCKDISLELLWSTSEVKNQPYKASIALHMIIRAIGSNDAEIENTITSLMRICKATLDFGKYDYRDVGFDELASRVRQIKDQSVKAVIKSEQLEMLQNNIMPYCFAFDRIPVTENDMSRIVSSLIDYPDCAVSFQLIPVTYSTEESAAVDGNAQMLDTLSKGVIDQSIGNVSFALAEKHAETYKYYSRSKNTAEFAFNMLVYGTPDATNTIATRILAHLNNSSELRIISLSAVDVKKDDNFYPLPSDEGIKSLSTYWNDCKDKLCPYPECKYCRYCVQGCDYNKRILGREIARRIFVKNFKPDNADSKIVKNVFRQMPPLIKQELNDEPFDQHLLACVELHLMRRIRYGTKIKISDATVQVTLSNIGGEA